MFPIFVVVLFLASVGTALNVSIQNAVPTRPSFSIQTVNQPLQACGQANIEDVVDASSSSEIILWKIGTVSIKEKETSCKVRLPIPLPCSPILLAKYSYPSSTGHSSHSIRSRVVIRYKRRLLARPHRSRARRAGNSNFQSRISIRPYSRTYLRSRTCYLLMSQVLKHVGTERPTTWRRPRRVVPTQRRFSNRQRLGGP